MSTMLRHVGLDVHADTIAVAVADPTGEVRALGVIPNRPDVLARVLRKVGTAPTLKVCYEAGPCGYVVYRQLAQLGIHCDVVAPTLVPIKVGDRVKTDRRDAAKLARCYRAGDLTPVWIPDAASEGLRDLVRAREAAKQDQVRARHRLSKLLLRRGYRPPAGVRAWTKRYAAWVQTVRFEQATVEATYQDYRHEVDHATARVGRLEQAITAAVAAAPPRQRAVIAALQALRGVKEVTAATIVSELGPLSRFTKPTQLMAYVGVVPREHSSGARIIAGASPRPGTPMRAGWAAKRP